RRSTKEQAENVMIVDLLRNDMGRVALPGSVQVSRLFEVQSLPTVWQMTSTVTARTRPGVGLPELFAALFPCGSVTGAPKARAMHWIAALEKGPRGVYCGAVGVVRPGGAATFNVPIRTVALGRDHAPTTASAQPGWRARYGVGSAITFYAEPGAEWRELAAKTRFLQRAGADFDLLETLRLEDGSFWLLDRHLARMANSAAYFGFDWQPEAVRACLLALLPGRAQGIYRVRLTCSAAGQPAAQVADLATTPEPVVFNLSADPLATQGTEHEFVVHKTTRRQHYDTRLLAAPGVFDTLLHNERGELTEFTRGNLALKLGGRWLTPALHCGLLAGTYRAELLASGEMAEAVLTLPDLHRAEAVAFFNSLRGWLVASWAANPRGHGAKVVGRAPCNAGHSVGQGFPG
ncbi:chorismate-binding protein, partial [Rhodoferax sp.]|uniref:chorismate-binding protein n=1 Tax=Rhodoferax sp. TaxID=50421 RepID=UPI0027506B63|nr:chorismate-binding protein [Rhodoferax sp.]